MTARRCFLVRTRHDKELAGPKLLPTGEETIALEGAKERRGRALEHENDEGDPEPRQLLLKNPASHLELALRHIARTSTGTLDNVRQSRAPSQAASSLAVRSV